MKKKSFFYKGYTHQYWRRTGIVAWFVLCFGILCGQPAGAGHPVDANNYSGALLPVPQRIQLGNESYLPAHNCKVIHDGAPEIKIAVATLEQGLKESGHASAGKPGSPSVELVVDPGAVRIGATVDTNRVAISRQAYRLELGRQKIKIIANAPQGLYYGVHTFLQLIRSNGGTYPEGQITDWPNVEIRMIYWDDAHHLEKMAALKRIIRQASSYKINAFALKLEGHFQYKSAAPIVEPYALSAKQYQELADYAKSHFIELVPYLDAPAHVAFILKHPEFAALRLFPDNNYQFSVTNPKTIALLHSMFGELINAGKGSRFVLLSNDEAYYTGKAPSEKPMADSLGGNGAVLAWFLKIMADSLYAQGRIPLFWGEYPLTASDINRLPSHMINGVYNKETATKFRDRGIRQFVYTATQGAEPVFPNYYPLKTKTAVLEDGSDRSSGRVADMLKEISTAFHERLSSFMGVVIAGWADAGLHPETFWLGYATGTAAGWNADALDPADATSRFLKSFYGPAQQGLDSVYRILSAQAEFHERSWNEIPSPWRTPIKGNSDSIFTVPQPATDQTLPLPPGLYKETLAIRNEVIESRGEGGGSRDSQGVGANMITGDATTGSDSGPAGKERLATAHTFLQQNEIAQHIIRNNKLQSSNQEYNLEVLQSVAALCWQNLRMLIDLDSITGKILAASRLANTPDIALGQIDAALGIALRIKKERDSILASVMGVWHKEWEPLVAKANGKTFVLQVDDIKDHLPVRTPDLSYLIYRQLHYPLQQWWDQLLEVRNDFAAKHTLPLSKQKLDWKKYK